MKIIKEKNQLENKKSKRRVTPLFGDLSQIDQNNVGNNSVDEIFLILKEDKSNDAKVSDDASKNEQSNIQESNFSSENNQFINQRSTKSDDQPQAQSNTVISRQENDDVDGNKILPVQQLVNRWKNDEVESSIEIKATIDTSNLPIRTNSLRNKRAIFEKNPIDKPNTPNSANSSFRKEILKVDSQRLQNSQRSTSLDDKSKNESKDKPIKEPKSQSESFKNNSKVELKVYKPENHKTKDPVHLTKESSTASLNKIKQHFKELSHQFNKFSKEVDSSSSQFYKQINHLKNSSTYTKYIKRSIDGGQREVNLNEQDEHLENVKFDIPDQTKITKELKNKPIIKSGLLKMKNDVKQNQPSNLKVINTKESTGSINKSTKIVEKKDARLSLSAKDYQPANYKSCKNFWESLCNKKS